MRAEKIINLYKKPGHPAAYSSAQTIYQNLKKRGLLGGLTQDSIEKALSRVYSHTRHLQKKKIKKFNFVDIYEKRHILQADLFDFSALSKDNNKVKYILLVQDTFTRYLWARPLINKTAAEVLKNFKIIHEKTGNFYALWTDEGTEFLAKTFQSFLKKNNIKHFHNFTSGHASHVERSGASLQRLIYKHMTENNTNTYIKHLPLFISTMNNRLTRGLGSIMTPAEAELPKNEFNVRMIHEKAYAKVKKQKKIRPFPVGQVVRLVYIKRPFARSYKEQNTDELFEVVSIDRTKRIPLYSVQTLLSDNKGKKEQIRGKFYHNELIPVTII